ncbi:MAG: glycosyltransferase [bacterium]|nr:glycosyltransferase [bacterium]
MKILFVTARFPYPPHKGDQAIPYYRLKLMGKRDEITLLTFYESKEELKYLDEIEPWCKEVITVKKSLARSLFNMTAWGLFSKSPFQVLYYRSRAFEGQLKRLTSETDFDIVHVYMLRIAGFGLGIKGPKVLELIDSMQLNFQRRAEAEKWPAKRLFKMELKRLKHYENQMVKAYDRSIVVSDTDREFIADENVKTIHLGIDTEFFRPEGQRESDPVIAFTGNMGYFPNDNAIRWFLENCWLKVKRRVPGVQLVIAGKGPGAAVKRHHDGESVRVLGVVDSMAEVLNQARIAIAPMQSGSGMQFKVLEAMACGLPVVATTLGLGTIPAHDGENVLIADDPESFSRRCSQLLTDDALATTIGQKGMELVRDTFGRQKNIDSLYSLYNEVLTK